MPEMTPYPRILLTAFDAYRDGSSFYAENASRLSLEHLRIHPPRGVVLETQIYAVDFQAIRQRIEQDISRGFDFVILTGQAPNAGLLRLEMIAKNYGIDPNGGADPFALAVDGPPRLKSTIDWRQVLSGLPVANREIAISEDAGTFLCNAALYFAILAAQRRWESGVGESRTRVGFVHVPLAPMQATSGAPCMATEQTALLLGEIIEIAALS